MAKKIISEVEKQLRLENQELNARLNEAEKTLNAIRNGEVDTIVKQGTIDKTVYSLISAETPYRVIIEEMSEGAVILMADGTILFCNRRFAELVSVPREEVMGANINHFFAEKEKQRFGGLMKTGLEKSCNGEILYLTHEGDVRYFYLSFSPLPSIILGDVCILISDITDRKKAEQALNDSEELHRITIANISDPVFITTDEGVFTYICPNVLKILGYTVHEIKQMDNISELVGEHLFDINDLNTHGIIANIEQPITYKSGIERDFLITVSRVSIQGGTVLYVCRDISERKLAEQALQESELKYRELVENSPDAIVIYVEGNIVFVNKAGLHFVAAACADELIGNPVIQFVHPDFKEFVIGRMNKIANQEAVLPLVEEKFVRLDGSEVDVEVMAISIRFDNKPAIQLIIRDITERKLAQQAIRESEAKYRMLINFATDGFFQGDIKGNIIDINNSSMELTGYTREELLKKNVKDLFVADSLNKYPLRFDLIDNNETVKIEREGIMKDGRKIVFEMNSKKMPDGTVASFFRDMTERKQSEEALRKSEEKWRTIFEILPVGISILDKNGNISEHNPALEKILQLTAEELHEPNSINRKYVYFDNGEMSQDEYPGQSSVQEQRIIRNIEVGIEKEDGDIIWTEISSAPLNLPDSICAVVTIDITEHKRLVSELKRSESLLSTTQQLTHVGGWEWDVDKQVMFWTKEMYDLFDLNPNRYVPGTPEYFDLHMECYLPEDRLKIREAVERCVAEGEPYDLEFRITTVKGRSYWIRLITKPVFKNGKVVRLTGVNMDINERKLFEKELMKREINYTVLFNTVRQAIYIQNPDSTFISVNQGAVEMYGYEKEYFIGKTPQFLSASGKNDMKQIMDYLKLAYKGRPQKYEFWGEKKSGVIFPEEIWTVKGKYFGEEVLISLAIDITERKLAEDEIQRKNEELQKISAEKDRFFSIIAHDLRSPFSGFLGLTELMVEGISGMKHEEIQELAQLMKTSATNLFRLLGNLLEWSRMQRGLTTFNPTSFILIPNISENLVLALDAADKKEITILYNVPEDLTVFADGNMLGVIIRNLVTNAIKFTPKGGSVTISAKAASDKSVEISIRDTGIGMSADMIGNLFRIDVNTSRRGTEDEYSTGLGLIICKDFIEKHGGKLCVESKEGKGSNFRFTLPANQGYAT